MARTKQISRKIFGGHAPRMQIADRAPHKTVSYCYRTVSSSYDKLSGEDEIDDENETPADSEEDVDNESSTEDSSDDTYMESASNSDSEIESDPGRRHEACSPWTNQVAKDHTPASSNNGAHQKRKRTNDHVFLSDILNESDDDPPQPPAKKAKVFYDAWGKSLRGSSAAIRPHRPRHIPIQPRFDYLKSPALFEELRIDLVESIVAPEKLQEKASHLLQAISKYAPDNITNNKQPQAEPITQASYIDSQGDLMFGSFSWEARAQHKRTGVHPFNFSMEDMQKNADAAAARRAAEAGQAINAPAAADQEARQHRRWHLEDQLPDVDTVMTFDDPISNVRIALANARLDLQEARVNERNYVHKYRIAAIQAAQRRFNNRPMEEQQQAEAYLQSCAAEREQYETVLRRARAIVSTLKQTVHELGIKINHTPLEVEMANEEHNDREEKDRLASLGLPVPRWCETGMQMLKVAMGPESDSENDE
jgi:hypothetical protein